MCAPGGPALRAGASCHPLVVMGGEVVSDRGAGALDVVPGLWQGKEAS